MFSGKLLAIVGAIFTVTAYGSPVKVVERELQARSLGNVYSCTDSGFGGACNLFGVDSSVCYNVPDGFNDAIGAFGPDKGIGCEIFEDSYCGGSSIFLIYPGDASLAGLGFGDIMSSFRCVTFN